jgi:aryl-alcohol dehydrogenase-like predicted oxidoreductase
MRRSLERSLRELGTSHVDVLLLHEPAPGDTTDEALEFLAACRAEGLAKAVGIATTNRAAASAILGRAADALEVAQTAWDDGAAYEPLPAASRVVLFSVIAAALGRMADAEAREPRAVRAWSDAVGVDLASSGARAGLALARARQAVPRSSVVFTSRRPEHVRETLEWAERGRAEPATTERFARLLASLRRGVAGAR